MYTHVIVFYIRINTVIISLTRTNLEPPWLQEAVFDEILYELDTSRNIAVKNSEKSAIKKIQRSISLAVSFPSRMCM